MSPPATGSHPVVRQPPGYAQSRAVAAALDLAICGFALMVAYLIRFDGSIPGSFYRQMLVLIPLLTAARVGVNYVFGVYRMMWRYIGLRETMRLAQSVAALSAIMLLLRVALPHYGVYTSVPISIIIIEGTFCFVGMTFTRFLPRIHSELRGKRVVGAPTLLVGAGRGGLAIAKEAQRHPNLGIRPIGFLDDDLGKAGKEMHGLRVLGTLREVERVIRQTGASQVIITTQEIPSRRILDLMNLCRPLGVNVRVIPGLYEVLGSPIAANTLREVRIEDLLSRDPVPPSLSLADLTAIYEGKIVMVTGAGGSIGSELCRQLSLMRPRALLLIERDETNLFEIERELAEKGLGRAAIPLLADVSVAKDLERAFREHRPDVIFHAAAYKHVPMMERFPWEAVRNNVFGTLSLARMADEHQVSTFVMVSTDKAVNPTSVMGASKRMCELVVQHVAGSSQTRFSCVRFGNVLGSRGSVVGIFRQQIENGGPVTVTHPEARRYFMTIPEAANLVIQSATLGAKGEVFLLDMGEPVRIIDLARQMIQLSGASEEDIPIRITGSRPGEKLFEELLTGGEDIEKTPLRKILRCEPTPIDGPRIDAALESLRFSVNARDAVSIRECLRDLAIGYEDQDHPARMPTDGEM